MQTARKGAGQVQAHCAELCNITRIGLPIRLPRSHRHVWIVDTRDTDPRNQNRRSDDDCEKSCEHWTAYFVGLKKATCECDSTPMRLRGKNTSGRNNVSERSLGIGEGLLTEMSKTSFDGDSLRARAHKDCRKWRSLSQDLCGPHIKGTCRQTIGVKPQADEMKMVTRTTERTVMMVMMMMRMMSTSMSPPAAATVWQ